MFTITVTEKGAEPAVLSFDQNEVTIGRVPGNDIILPKTNISKQHAIIEYKTDETFVVTDAKSTNGTYVNARKIDAPVRLVAGDRVSVGDFMIEVSMETEHRSLPRPPPPPHESIEFSLPELSSRFTEETPPLATPNMVFATSDYTDSMLLRIIESPKALSQKSHHVQSVGHLIEKSAHQVRNHLGKKHGLPPNIPVPSDDPAIEEALEQAVRELVADLEINGKLPGDQNTDDLVHSILIEALLRSPFEELLHDESVQEIVVTGPSHIFARRNAALEPFDGAFADGPAIIRGLKGLLGEHAKRLSADKTVLDIRLARGLHIQALLPPLCEHPTIRISRTRADAVELDDLVMEECLDANMAKFLDVCVQGRKNILFSGAPGTRRVQIMSGVAGIINFDERVVSIETRDTLGIQLPLLTRVRPSVTERRAALIHAVAFNPERILIDQLDRTLAFEFLATLQSCCWGSMAAIEANTPRQALARLANLAMAGEHHLKPEAADQLVSEAIDIVVHLMQFADGSERIVRISEVMPIIEGEIILRDLFVFKLNGHADGGRVTGTFGPTGAQPTFLRALQSLGIDINSQIFETG